MNEFDLATYDSYLADLNYEGLANYISSFIPQIDDENQKMQLMQNVNSLRHFGGIASKILQSEIPDEDRALFKFNLYKSYGIAPNEKDDITKNIFDEYNKYKNNIGNKDHWFKSDDIAASIGYVFDNNEAFNTFADKTHIRDNNNVAIGIQDGKPIVKIHKSAFQNDEFFDNITKALEESVKYESVTYGLQTGNAIITNVPISTFKTISYNQYGSKLDEWTGLDDNQLNAYNLSKQGSVVYDKYYTSNYEKLVPSELVSLGYMCGAQAKLNNMLFNQQIDGTTYNAYIKPITDFYDRQLASISLANYPEVYMTEPGNTSQTLNMIDDEAKGTWTRYLRAALKEGRVNYQAGTSGGRVGTIITISDKIRGDEIGEESFEKGVQIFVPGLFEEDARNMINQSSEAKLMVETAEHQVFGHDYNLIGGGRLINFDGDGGAIYQDDISEHYVTPDQVKALMLQNIMIEGGIQEAKSMFKHDDNGNILNNQKEVVDKLGIFAQNIYSELNNISTTEQLEKALEQPEIAQAIDNIFITILNELGLDRLGNFIN